MVQLTDNKGLTTVKNLRLTTEQADELRGILDSELATLATELENEGDVELRRRVRDALTRTQAIRRQLGGGK